MHKALVSATAALSIVAISVTSLAASEPPEATASTAVETSSHAVTHELEVYQASPESTRKCVRLSTPAGPKRTCRTIRAASGVHKVRFCVQVKNKKYCRVVRVDLGPGPSDPDGSTDDTTLVPGAPEDYSPDPGTATGTPGLSAPPYKAPDLDSPHLAGSESDYRLMGTVGAQGGGRINPCAVFTWSVSGTESQEDIARQMVNIWADRLGIATREVPAPQFRPFVDTLPMFTLPEESGLPTMVLAWMDPADVSYLKDGAIGVTSRRILGGSAVSFVQVALSTRAGEHFPAQRQTELLESLVLHELGHGAGLSHSTAASQVMFPMVHSSSPSRYQRGDLAGLHEVARFRDCLPG